MIAVFSYFLTFLPLLIPHLLPLPPLTTSPPFLLPPPLQMSIIDLKSPKHCAIKQELTINKRYKKLFYLISTSFTSLVALLFLIWFILHPAKPHFSLKEADIYQLNLSTPHLLNSSIQLTISSKNPNKKVGIYYDQIQAYAVYKGQQITVDASLPPFYQGHEDSNLLTASLVGTGLPVAASFGYEVGRDQMSGKLVVNMKVNGKLRWKIGTWVSGRYRFDIDCVAVMPFGPTASLSVPLSLTQGTQCSTSI